MSSIMSLILVDRAEPSLRLPSPLVVQKLKHRITVSAPGRRLERGIERRRVAISFASYRPRARNHGGLAVEARVASPVDVAYARPAQLAAMISYGPSFAPVANITIETI
jgi:hypothetical protein